MFFKRASVGLSVLCISFLFNLSLLAQDNDNTLRAVTWNLEWFGSKNSGPSNEFRQSINAAIVINKLKPDMIAFQEIASESALQSLADRLDEPYVVLFPSHISGGQKMCFLLKESAFQVLDEGGWGSAQGLDDYDWAGRFPYYVLVNYSNLQGTYRMRFVTIHAKAFDDSESYNRRRNAADDLHNYLDVERSSERIIFLGDYNDDVDVSITVGRPTPYQPFVVDENDFTIVTAILSEQKRRSTVSYNEMIDHITITDDLENDLVSMDTFVENPESYIANYGNTTSDHYPVVADFNYAETTVINEDLPFNTSLSAYPNPFNPSTTLSLNLAEAQQVTINIYNMMGQRVIQLEKGRFVSAGQHLFPINFGQLPTGVYTAVVQTNEGFKASILLTLIR